MDISGHVQVTQTQNPMPKSLPELSYNARLSIREAADLLKVSTKTLRRWEKQGLLIPERTPGNQRRYNLYQLQAFTPSRKPILNHPTAVVTPSSIASASTRTSRKTSHRQVYMAGLLFFLVFTVAASWLAPRLAEKIAVGIPSSPAFARQKGLSFLSSFFAPDSQPVPSLDDSGLDLYSQVLAAEAELEDFSFIVNLPSNFSKDLTVEGTLTAPNIIYSVIAGDGISITPGQNPIISTTETGGVTSFQGLEGEITLTAGSGIAIEGTTIRNSAQNVVQSVWKNIAVSGQTSLTAGSADDTLTLVAGTGIGLTTNTTDKKLTINATSTGDTSGFTDTGTLVKLITATDILGLGTSTGSAKLSIESSSGDLLTASSSGVKMFALTSAGTLTLSDTGLLDLSNITHSTSAPQGLLLPQADSLTNPSSGEGYIAYDTDNNQVLIYNGSSWANISGASTTLQEAYGNDVDGSDTTISLTSLDDSLVFSNPSSSGTDSNFILSIDQLAAGAVDNLRLSNSGTGAEIAFASVTPTVSISNGGTLNITDGTNTLFTLLDDGTVGKVGLGSVVVPVGILEVSGSNIGKSLVILNEAGDQNILTASASGVTVANITRGGDLELKSQGELRLFDSDGSNYTGFAGPPDLISDLVYTLPAAAGLTNYVLTWQSGNATEWKEIAGVGGVGDITSVGSVLDGPAFSDTSSDDDWLGLGASAGRIEFDNQDLDEVNILAAKLGIGTQTPTSL